MTWARKAGERLRAMRSDEGAVEAVIALVRWMRDDRVERPWRLTRRQRVEMEAALADMRRDADERSEGLAAEDRVYDAAVVAGLPELSHPAMVLSRGCGARRAWRTLRARVAIALRAALRADEDARCEEAALRIASAHPDTYEVADYVEGTGDGIDALREWPATVPQTRDTGVRISLLEWAQRFGSFVPDLDTLDAEGREEWTSRRLPVLATAYALWERTR